MKVVAGRTRSLIGVLDSLARDDEDRGAAGAAAAGVEVAAFILMDLGVTCTGVRALILMLAGENITDDEA